MAPFFNRALSKADRGGEELLLELEALNQALQSKSHIRSKSLASHSASPLRASDSKSSCKRPLQPRPSFKVPFRSTSISCDRPKRLLNSSSTKQNTQHDCQQIKKQETAAHPLIEKEEVPQHFRQEALHNSKLHGKHHQYQKSRYPQNKGKGSPQHSGKKGRQHHEKKSLQYDQVYEQKSIWRWGPLRAISHMILGSHHRINVLFSLQVHRIECLPLPMNGLRLVVLWICKGHCLKTTPSRIVNGIAEFGETLQYQCMIHSTQSSSKNIDRYEAKPCTLSIMALDTDNPELARHHVDLSSLLPQDYVTGNLWQDKCQDSRYRLSGVAKGGTLIITFHCNLVHQSPLKAIDVMRSSTKKTTLLTKSLLLSKDGSPLVDQPEVSSSPCFSEPGVGVHLRHSIGHLDDDELRTLQETLMRDRVNAAIDLSGDDLSDSFEFKPPLNQLEDDFSFSQSQFKTSIYDECFPTNFPFNHTIHMDDEYKPPEPLTLQKACDSIQNRLPTRSQSIEEARCMRQPKMDFDDELESITEEFLNMLGIGFDSGHPNSEDDLESPRERLLRQFEDDNLIGTTSHR